MENIPRDVLKILAMTGTQTIPGDSDSFNINLEWVKWLSYTPDFEKKRIEDLKKKKNKTTEEFKEVGNYYYFKRMEKQFKKYGTPNMDVDEYEEVLLFMKQRNLEEFMRNKLTEEELETANDLIEKYKTVSDKELFDKVYSERKMNNYIDLSMVDAYVLHFINPVVLEINTIRYQKIIDNQVEESADRSQKSFVYTSNPNKKH